MPISMRTMASKRRRQEYDERLIAVEQAIYKFTSKNTIYIDASLDEVEEEALSQGEYTPIK